MKHKFQNIVVLYGGVSSEREISIRSGRAVSEALKAEGISVEDGIIGQDHMDALRFKRWQAAFIVMHGHGGEDGEIQDALEALRIPYTGSGPEASRLAFYKDEAKRLFIKNDVPTPAFGVVKEMKDLDSINIAGPWVVKPVDEGSSIGVSMVGNRRELSLRVSDLLEAGKTVLVESRIMGREMTVSILGDQALPVIEVRPKRSFYDYEAKYVAGLTEYMVPASVSSALNQSLASAALKVHRVLGLSGFSRIDFMVDEKDRPYVLEANSIPGFTNTSLLPKAARAAGWSFGDLCVEILNSASLKSEHRLLKRRRLFKRRSAAWSTGTVRSARRSGARSSGAVRLARCVAGTLEARSVPLEKEMNIG